MFRQCWTMVAAILVAMLSFNSGSAQNNSLPFEQPPTWARKAIWYQIFVERFRSGGGNNNPTLQTCDKALFDAMPPSWQVTPWGHDWYRQEPWAKETGLDFYRTIQMRRYGGDLAGVQEKIPYLKELGINAIYFNPLNDAPSLHKYDARHYHHIDVTFGDDPLGDEKLIALENPADPDTWQWTNADKKFVEIIRILHQEGIRVVLDFSWNHTGMDFWAFRDVQKNKSASPYKDWYHTHFVQDAATGEEKMEYEGWVGIKSLPELRKIETTGKIQGHPYEGNMQPDVKKHIFDVCRKWMDPNGDGNPDDGIDGMRLDVAEHVPMGFWREFRHFVRQINPEFYLIGENWWTKWPDELMDPAPWVKGDVFDAVMHYQWFKVARGYFAQPEDGLTLQQFRVKLDSVFLKYPDFTQQAMMNLASSHDSPRLITAFLNRGKYKYNCSPSSNPAFLTGKPDEVTMKRIRLFLLHQFTFVGAPHIWNGDEMGMTGADDPDNRKPLIWEDIAFDEESPSPGVDDKKNRPLLDHTFLRFHQTLIALRKSNDVFSFGDYRFVTFPNDEILAYERRLDGNKILVLFNLNETAKRVSLPAEYKDSLPVFSLEDAKKEAASSSLYLGPLSGIVVSIPTK